LNTTLIFVGFVCQSFDRRVLTMVTGWSVLCCRISIHCRG
jgi:hypothetical protein